MRLRGRCAIVTGGAGVWGAVIARRLVAEGAQVWLADIHAEGARRLAATLGPMAHAHAVDVGDAGSVRVLVEAVESQARQVDILVNAASFQHRPQPLEGLQEHQFDRLVAVNLKGLYLLACELVPRWKAQHQATGEAGVIVNVLQATRADPDRPMPWQEAGARWLEAATRAMAAELAPAGIRVVAIAPRAAAAGVALRAGTAPDGSLSCSGAGEPSPADPQGARRVPIIGLPPGTAGTPEALGHAAVWLCGRQAAAVSGLTLDVEVGAPPSAHSHPGGR